MNQSNDKWLNKTLVCKYMHNNFIYTFVTTLHLELGSIVGGVAAHCFFGETMMGTGMARHSMAGWLLMLVPDHCRNLPQSNGNILGIKNSTKKNCNESIVGCETRNVNENWKGKSRISTSECDTSAD